MPPSIRLELRCQQEHHATHISVLAYELFMLGSISVLAYLPRVPIDSVRVVLAIGLVYREPSAVLVYLEYLSCHFFNSLFPNIAHLTILPFSSTVTITMQSSRTARNCLLFNQYRALYLICLSPFCVEGGLCLPPCHLSQPLSFAHQLPMQPSVLSQMSTTLYR